MDIDITIMSSKGQIVIPRDVRKRIGWQDGQPLAISMQDGLLVLKKVSSTLEAEELRTLKEIKRAWKEIKAGKCKRVSSEEFLRDLKQW